jgi:hypothetical protein
MLEVHFQTTDIKGKIKVTSFKSTPELIELHRKDIKIGKS